MNYKKIAADDAGATDEQPMEKCAMISSERLYLVCVGRAAGALCYACGETHGGVTAMYGYADYSKALEAELIGLTRDTMARVEQLWALHKQGTLVLNGAQCNLLNEMESAFARYMEYIKMLKQTTIL